MKKKNTLLNSKVKYTCSGLEIQGDENQEQTTFLVLTQVDMTFPFSDVQ